MRRNLSRKLLIPPELDGFTGRGGPADKEQAAAFMSRKHIDSAIRAILFFL